MTPPPKEIMANVINVANEQVTQEKKKKEREPRHTSFCMVIYPAENEMHAFALKYLVEASAGQFEVIAIDHKGEPKIETVEDPEHSEEHENSKEHTHLLLHCKGGQRTLSSMQKYCRGLVEGNLIKPCSDQVAYAHYMIHNTMQCHFIHSKYPKNKIPYSINDVYGNNDYRAKLLQNSNFVEFKELYELSEKTSYGESMSIGELINQSMENGDWEMLNFIKSNTYLACAMTSQSIQRKRYTTRKDLENNATSKAFYEALYQASKE